MGAFQNDKGDIRRYKHIQSVLHITNWGLLPGVTKPKNLHVLSPGEVHIAIAQNSGRIYVMQEAHYQQTVENPFPAEIMQNIYKPISYIHRSFARCGNL